MAHQNPIEANKPSVTDSDSTKCTNTERVLQVAYFISIGVSGIAYPLAITLGYVPQERRLDGASVAILALATTAVAVVLWPDLFGRVSSFGIAGLLSIELTKVKEELTSHTSQLEIIRLMLPLLLPTSERTHLLELAEGTSDHTGSHGFRTELRRLRSIGLIHTKSGRHIAEIVDGVKTDLSQYIQLTQEGVFWAERIREMERERGEPAGIRTKGR